MRVIGIILIALVLVLYSLWIRFTMNREGVAGKEKDGERVFDILVKGVYSPNVLKVRPGEKVSIRFKREEDSECSRHVNFPDFKIRRELPRDKTVEIDIKPEKKGEFIFTCDMSMYQGKLIVE